MNIGDRVAIYDYASDLFIFDGEIIDITGSKAIVIIERVHRGRYEAVADVFDVDKLEIMKKKKVS